MSDRPNIVFIISDQMTAVLTSVYGHPVVQTPNLQRLAAESVRFDAAYTPIPSLFAEQGVYDDGTARLGDRRLG